MIRTIGNKIAFTQARDLLSEGIPVRIRVQGQSMLPFFRSGSPITLRPLREGDLRRGSVVLAETAGGTFVVHRIMRVARQQVTLLGDGNINGTETVTRDKIYGTVDCGAVHRILALAWLRMRPLRRYPLWLLRRICSK